MLQFTYPWESIKDAQGTEEALKKEKSRTSKHEISSLFTFLWDIFALLGPDAESGGTAVQEPDPADQNQCRSMRFPDPVPDLQHWNKLLL
jgi:hypothetical protein